MSAIPKKKLRLNQTPSSTAPLPELLSTIDSLIGKDEALFKASISSLMSGCDFLSLSFQAASNNDWDKSTRLFRSMMFATMYELEQRVKANNSGTHTVITDVYTMTALKNPSAFVIPATEHFRQSNLAFCVQKAVDSKETSSRRQIRIFIREFLKQSISPSDAPLKLTASQSRIAKDWLFIDIYTRNILEQAVLTSMQLKPGASKIMNGAMIVDQSSWRQEVATKLVEQISDLRRNRFSVYSEKEHQFINGLQEPDARNLKRHVVDPLTPPDTPKSSSAEQTNQDDLTDPVHSTDPIPMCLETGSFNGVSYDSLVDTSAPNPTERNELVPQSFPFYRQPMSADDYDFCFQSQNRQIYDM